MNILNVRSISASIIVAVSVALGVAALGDSPNLWVPNDVKSATFQPMAAASVHETRAEPLDALRFSNAVERAPIVEGFLPAPATRSSFMANWETAAGVTGYLLDVSKSPSFDSYVDGYHDLDVGNAAGVVVTGLSQGTTYYYRVRAYQATQIGEYSGVATGITVPTTGLTIHATFDSSITGNRNAAAIEAMINRCISIYESLFRDPITIQIRFRYATTAPDGTPLPAGAAAMSLTAPYSTSWNTFINALRADARTGNDFSANLSLPASALSPNVIVSSSNGRALGAPTPPDMFANGSLGNGGPYDGIVTLNSAAPFQFTRPTSVGNLDAQRFTEHEMDEVIGIGSRLGQAFTDLRPQDLFSWSSSGHRNITSSGTRYFSISGGVTNIVNFNQTPNRDFGDWLSTSCPQTHPYVQNAVGCTGQSSDVTATSPEGITLDVIGYDLVGAPPPPVVARALVGDFNGDGHPDYVVQNATTHQTAIWYLNNNIVVGTAYGPTLPGSWRLRGVADFNRDSHPDFALFAPNVYQTAIWYLSGPTLIATAYGPTVPGGWELVGSADFNWDGYPDYVLYNASTRQTAVWYMNNNVAVGGGYGPTLPAGWGVVGLADFDRDGNTDCALFNPITDQTMIAYLSGTTLLGTAYGPTVPSGWALVATADFNGDGYPDYLLYNASTRQTAIWYLNNNIVVASAYGPTLPSGWSLVAP